MAPALLYQSIIYKQPFYTSVEISRIKKSVKTYPKALVALAYLFPLCYPPQQ